MNKFIANYEIACFELAQAFVNCYFEKDTEFDWVDIGAVLNVGDFYFDNQSIITAIEMNVSKDDLFEHYDSALEAYMEGETFPNLKNWLKMEGRDAVKL